MTAQEQRIDRIAQSTAKFPEHLHPGRVWVNKPYRDGSVEVTIGTGCTWLVDTEGHLTVRPRNHTPDWSL